MGDRGWPLKRVAAPGVPLLLSISCDSLKRGGVLARCDPQVSVARHSTADTTSTSWKELGRTEAVANNAHPIFGTKIRVDYCFELLCPIKFTVYDASSVSRDGKMAILGMAECDLGEIVSTKNFWKDLYREKEKVGKIRVRAEQRKNTGDLKLRLRASDLVNKDWLSKSDPYIEIYKHEGSDEILVYRSEVVMDNLSPSWRPLSLPLDVVCNCDSFLPITFRCYDFDSEVKSDYLGEVKTNIHNLISGQKKLPFKQKSNQPAGELIVDEAILDKGHTFFDYINAGLKLNVVVGVDFSTTDRLALVAESCEVMRGLTDILSLYRGTAAGYGYGALVDSKPNHSFQFHSPEQPISGLLGSLTEAAQKNPPAGEAVLSQLVSATAPLSNSYNILVIISAGRVDDVDATLDAIAAVSDQPVSIVLIGIGKGELKTLESLETTANGGGEEFKREIVAFASHREHHKDESFCRQSLAREALMEVPKQLVDYMRKC